MTPHRRTLGRGRLIAAIAGLVLLVGCVLPWWRLGGADGIPPVGGNGFEASGIVVFLVAIATLFLVTLPYAAGDRPVGLDRWISYAILAAAGWLGLGLRILDLALGGALVFREPEQVLTNGPGLWVVVVGLAALSRAAWEIAQEPRFR